MRNIINNEAHKAYNFIKKGGIILYPTDTVWGLGCDATNCSAVEKIYHLKKRSLKTPMLSLVKDVNMIVKYTCSSLNEVSRLLESTNKPTTVIYPKGRNLCNYILSEDGSIGFRVPQNSFCIDLLSLMKKPLISTSANIHKEEFPLSFEEINNDILKQVDYIVNLPRDSWCTKPSSVLKLDEFGNFYKIR
tara:strand:- start:2331 stop:2900 length:570 start_codon:yes stop_codon:yes gene_type:complete